MRQTNIDVDDFDLAGFAEEVLGFLGGQVSEEVHPSYAIVKVAAPGGFPQFGPGEGRSNFLEELESGHLLFFPFSSSYVDEPVPCADGQSRQLDEDTEPAIGDVDCVGFLLQLKQQRLIIDSAIHAGGGLPPPPSVDIEYCGVFDAGMEAFISRFILA